MPYGTIRFKTAALRQVLFQVLHILQPRAPWTAVATEQQVNIQFRHWLSRVVFRFDTDVDGVWYERNTGTASPKLIQRCTGSRDINMIDAFESIKNPLHVGLQEKSVNVSKRDSDIRVQLPGFQKRIVFDDVTVVNDDQFRNELAAGLKKSPVRRIPTKVPQSKRCVEGGDISVTEIEYLMPVAHEPVVQLSIGEDSNFAVSPYLKIACQ